MKPAITSQHRKWLPWMTAIVLAVGLIWQYPPASSSTAFFIALTALGTAMKIYTHVLMVRMAMQSRIMGGFRLATITQWVADILMHTLILMSITAVSAWILYGIWVTLKIFLTGALISRKKAWDLHYFCIFVLDLLLLIFACAASAVFKVFGF